MKMKIVLAAILTMVFAAMAFGQKDAAMAMKMDRNSGLFRHMEYGCEQIEIGRTRPRRINDDGRLRKPIKILKSKVRSNALRVRKVQSGGERRGGLPNGGGMGGMRRGGGFGGDSTERLYTRRQRSRQRYDRFGSRKNYKSSQSRKRRQIKT